MGNDVRIQNIYGWVGIHETSKGDMLIHLYDTNPGLKWAIAKVYEEDFNKLPPHLQADINKVLEKEGVDTKAESAPTKEKAEASGIMRYINPEFEVPISNKRIVWEQASELAAGKLAAGSGPGSFVWKEPLTEEQWKIAGKVAGDVSGLYWQLVHEVMGGFEDMTGAEDLTTDMFADLIPEVYRSASYEFGRLWKQAVQQGPEPSQMDFSLLDGAILALKESDTDQFFDIVADNHALIVDGDHVKVILKMLGETGLKSNADGRVTQARKVWMYIDLTSRHEMQSALAKKMVDEAYDQIAF